jgi:tetratricopeptide (TPR) repeat protein
MPAWIGSRNAEAVTITLSEVGHTTNTSATPRTAAAAYEDAEQAFGQGRWVAAGDAFRQAIELDPTMSAAHTGLARTLLNQHRVNDAVEQAKRSVDAHPESAEARATLAVAYDWLGLVDRAEQVGLEAVALDHQSPRALAALAEAYADQYRVPEADEFLTLALSLAPDDPEMHRTQGVLRETLADYAGAVESYRHAIELAPNWSYLFVSLGHALRAQQSYDEALVAFGRAAELSPTDARAEGGRGMVFHAREEHEAAAEHLQRAISLDPTYATAYAQLGWLHYGRREYEQAEPLFVRAIELDRDASRIAQYRHALGWIFLRSKRNVEARDQFQQALNLNPALQGARDGLVLLQDASAAQNQPPTPAQTRRR